MSRQSRPPPVSTEPAPAGSKPGGRLYVPTLAGFLYLAIVLDAFDMAVEQHRPDSVIHHSVR